MSQQSQAPFPHYFSGYVQDGKIYVQTYEGTQQIGVTYQINSELQKQHAELLEISESYKKRLIELGEIEVVPTQEQLLKQQSEELREARLLIQRMAAKLDEFTGVTLQVVPTPTPTPVAQPIAMPIMPPPAPAPEPKKEESSVQHRSAASKSSRKK